VKESVLELRDVVVAYEGPWALDVPHLAVRRGEILTLLGENGSGKTTLLGTLGLLIRPRRGRVVFEGEEVDFTHAKVLLEGRRRMAGVMQVPLLCRMSVRENVAMGLRFRRLPRAEIRDRVDAWLARLSIAHLADRPASKLSGGEAQRTSLARAMVLNPDVLLLDEPFSALDAPTRQNLLQELRALLEESGVTAVFATHSRGEALALGDHVAVLMGGRVAQVGPTEAVFARPDTVDVARFLGIETLIPGRVTGISSGRVQVDCGEILIEAESEYQTGSEVYVAVGPGEVSLQQEGSPAAEGDFNVLSGRVTRVSPGETHHRIEIDCGVRVVAAVSRARFRELGLEVGGRVQAAFPRRTTHLIRRVAD